MLESLSGSDLLNELAHEFSERYRRGERPPLAEYLDRYPELAVEIRELFPTLVMMEQFGSGVEHASGPSGRRARVTEPVPELLGDYRIVREIGRGGMGIVYEAVQESLGRRVALKVLSHLRQLGPIQLLRFEREARSAALLHHTNIVPVFGVGEHEGVHYYAMQYIEGQSLDAILAEIMKIRAGVHGIGEQPSLIAQAGKSASLAEGLLTRGLPALRTPADMRQSDVLRPVSSRTGEASSLAESIASSGSSSTLRILFSSEAQYFRSVARIGMQAAEALGYAHLHGVLHRDIKPANLLLDMGGTIWVTDFGLAKAEGSDELTNPGDIVGTLRYMAPERFRGESDARSDVYSLGLTLYEMLTFAPAFSASHRVEYIHAILHEEPKRPRSFDRLIPRDLETIVVRAISKNPSERFATADEMARELGRFVDGRPILSRRVWPHERLWRWSKRNRMTAALILLAATLTSLLALGSTVAAWNYRVQRDAIRAEESKTRKSRDRATRAEREREVELVRTLRVAARSVRLAGQPGRRKDALASLERASQIAHTVKASPESISELRDETIAALALPDDSPVKVWSGLPAFGDWNAFSIAGDRYVQVDGGGLIHVYRLSDRAKTRVLGSSPSRARRFPVFVPGGRYVRIVASSEWMELWDLEQGVLPDAWPADTRGAAATADGAQVVALRQTGELVVFDLPSFRRRSSCALGFDVPKMIGHNWMSLSNSGRQLALIRPDEKVVCLVDLDTGRIAREIKMPPNRVERAVALNRSGGLLAIGHDRSISVFDMADGEQLSLLLGHQSEGIGTRFQPDGDLLVSASWDGTTRLWDPIRGRPLLTLVGDFREWVDGGSSMVVATGHELVVRTIAPRPERRSIDCRMLGASAGEALYGPARVAYSPDGQLLAMAVRPEGVRIVRTLDGAGMALLPIGMCDEVLFMPSGDLLTYNARGLLRWPMRKASGASFELGPPRPLVALGREPNQFNHGLAVSADSQIIGAAAPTRRGSMLLEADHPWRRTWLTSHLGVNDLAISADGRWACSGSRGDGADRRLVKVWDISTGKLATQLSLGNARVAFSPDSRWLGTGGETAFRFYETGSWKLVSTIEIGEGFAEMPLAFHPGNKIAALLDAGRSIVRIIDVGSGEVIARLEAPEQTAAYDLTFSPDGRFLAVPHSDQRVDVWDLSLIRSQLESFGLAEGIPDVFNGSTSNATPTLIERIDVRGADSFGRRLLTIRYILSRGWFTMRQYIDSKLTDSEELQQRGDRWAGLGRWQFAVADYRASLARNPQSARNANELAWLLASAPGRGDPQDALLWARRAVELDRNSPDIRNTLGAALYRAGQYAEAAAVLERNVPTNPVGAGLDLIFLAMCRQRLGQPAAARKALAGARRWRANLPQMSPLSFAEFESCIREFESLPGASYPDLPADIFAR